MKSYMCQFLWEFSYPEEACEVLKKTCSIIYSDKSLTERFEALLECYRRQMTYDFQGILDAMTQLCSEADIHVYTGHMFLLICMSKTLRQYYESAGVADEIWRASIFDLKYKLMECKSVYNVWGVFGAKWQDKFFSMQRFAFGNLQFEEAVFGRNYEKEGIVLTPESRVIKVHIPRTGSKLDRESLKESYRKAAVFFEDQPMVFVCSSWLLYPHNKEILSPDSNLYAFMSDYEIIDYGCYEDYSNVWRLFDVHYKGDVEQLPQNTSLRRAYADWIRKGEKVGWGFGVYVYKEKEGRREL